jgi:large subunit ribosomal protein L20
MWLSHNERLANIMLAVSTRCLQTHSHSPFLELQHKNLLKFAKGYRSRSKNCFSIAIRRVQKAWQYGFRDRKVKRREWRKLWIQRVQAGVRQYGRYNYSRFIPALAAANIQLNRKVLAEMAANEPFAFKSIVDTVIAVQDANLARLPNSNNITGGRISHYQAPVQKELRA